MIPSAYIDEFLELTLGKDYTNDQLSRIKLRLCKKHSLNKPPTNIELLLSMPPELAARLSYLSTKPGRAASGVSVVSVMTEPHDCPHGKCVACPGGLGSHFGDIPQSYTGQEPATRRAVRNRFDAYLQVMNRLEQYIVSGHPVDKIELIVMGGTFPARHFNYQKNFIRDALKAMNDFGRRFYKRGVFDVLGFREFFELPGRLDSQDRENRIRRRLIALKKSRRTDLYSEQKNNEKTHVRCISLVLETRPDYAYLSHAKRMLALGATKVELGVQSNSDSILERIGRGHTTEDAKIATRILKDLGFKINYHMMPGLPGVKYETDIQSLKEIFSDPDYRPDMLKIYPCMVLKGTKLYDMWKRGEFIPLDTEKAAKLIAEFKKVVPKYVRIMRVQRDIPTYLTEAGVDRTNLRQYIHRIMQQKGEKCQCIRCREVGRSGGTGPYELRRLDYDASQGEEVFISAENEDCLLGFCRLRFPSQSLVPEISADSAIVRELHVYGDNLRLGEKGSYQHKGWGRRLLEKAEEIALQKGSRKMVVISGIGVRQYYRKKGYRRQGPYMVKKIY